MVRATTAICKALEAITCCLLTILCAVTFLGVADRYVLHTGIGWTEELARFLLIWSSFLSATVVVHRSGHFCIAFLVEMLPEAARRAVALALHLVTIGVLGVVFVQGVRVTVIMRIQVSPAMDLPMNWIYLSLPVSTALMIFFLTVQLTEMLRALRSGP
jgi:TRAP-type C4-dicarboxylate transport system permease small subunit